MQYSPVVTPRASISGPSSAPNRSSPAQIDTHAYSSAPAFAPSPHLRSTTLKPIGIVNEQNTCFLNSTFQALSATAPLISLLSTTPSDSLNPVGSSSLPHPARSRDLIPSLQPETVEPPLYQLLAVTHAFQTSLHKAWRMKDAGGGTSGPTEESSTRSMSLRTLLKEMAKKYDQYDEYSQQDAHELLRHLLDSMEMEERDVVKKLQPQPPLATTRRRSGHHVGISPLPSPVPSPATSDPPSPIKPTPGDQLATAAIGSQQVNTGANRVIPESERMIPFVDVLFGGSLASVVVCEKCKSVSHTYEGFLDISLSLKGDGPRARKRDKLKAWLRPGKPAAKPSGGAHHSDLSSSLGGVMSETELSDTETRESQPRRDSMDQDDRPGEASLSRSTTAKGFGGLKNKSSFSFRRKPSKPSTSTNSPIAPPSDPIPPVPSHDSVHSHHSRSKSISIGPTAAQSAYIQRILSGSAATEHVDPLAKLHAANHSDVPPVSVPADYGLVESLKAFTSVEVLEGDNAFACRKCWKVKSGRYVGHEETVHEVNEDELGNSSPPLVPTNVTAPPAISIMSDSASDRILSPGEESDRLTGRTSSINSRTSGSQSATSRAPSPLRNRADPSDRSFATTQSAGQTFASSDSAVTGSGSDGLSDSDSSDNAPPPLSELPIGRPKLPARRKSMHSVLRRAYKRYLIAKAPEVLVFHFKRFRQTHKSGLTFTSFYDLKKMDDFVSFPEVLDLAPFLAPNRSDYKVVPTPLGPRAPYMDWSTPEQGPELQPVLYRLYAVVVHLGTMVGGHYVAYCLVDPEQMFGPDSAIPADGVAGLSLDGRSSSDHGSEGKKEDRRVWCFCSDTSIRLASVEEVLSAKAYLCFYERINA